MKKEIDYKKEWDDEVRFSIGENKEWDKFYRLHTHKKITPPEKVLIELINKEDVILDIGCAYGRIMRLFPNARGIDVSKEMLKRNPYKNKIQLMDSTKGLNFKDESFDNVICVHVLQHIKDDKDIEKVLLESNRVLKKEGCIFINAIPKYNLSIFIWKMKLIYWSFFNNKRHGIGKTNPISGRCLTVKKMKNILENLDFSYKVFQAKENESVIRISKLSKNMQ